MAQQGNRSKGGRNKQKKRVNRVFSLVGYRCANEFAQWISDCDLKSQIVDDLICADGDTIERAYRAGGFSAASRAVISITCPRLLDQEKLDSSDCSSLEKLFELCAEKIREDEESRRKKKEEAKKPKNPTPSLALSENEKQAVMEAFTSVLRVEREAVEKWTALCLNKVQQAVLWKALAGSEKQTAVDTIKDLAACQTDDERTDKARVNGLLQFGSALALLQVASRLEDTQSAALARFIGQLSPVQRDQVNISMNALSEKEQETVARLLSGQTDFQEFLAKTQQLGLVAGGM